MKTLERATITIPLHEYNKLVNEHADLKAKLVQVEADAAVMRDLVRRLALAVEYSPYSVEERCATGPGQLPLVREAKKLLETGSGQRLLDELARWQKQAKDTRECNERIYDELEALRETATRRLELLRKAEGPISDVAALGNCDCDIPNGRTCLTCQLAIIHKALMAELKEAK